MISQALHNLDSVRQMDAPSVEIVFIVIDLDAVNCLGALVGVSYPGDASIEASHLDASGHFNYPFYFDVEEVEICLDDAHPLICHVSYLMSCPSVSAW